MESYFHTALYGPKLGQERGGGGDPRGNTWPPGNTWPNTPWNFQMLRLHLPSFGLEYSALLWDWEVPLSEGSKGSP